jgi:hypothetical protein
MNTFQANSFEYITKIFRMAISGRENIPVYKSVSVAQPNKMSDVIRITEKDNKRAKRNNKVKTNIFNAGSSNPHTSFLMFLHNFLKQPLKQIPEINL